MSDRNIKLQVFNKNTPIDESLKRKFYRYSQNNSGGEILEHAEKGIAEYVVVQAHSAKDADEIMESIVECYSWYCECCGERWDISAYEGNGSDVAPTLEDIFKEYRYGRHEESSLAVHYLNGDIFYYTDKVNES